MTPTEVEYITEEDAEEAERLCGAIGELIINWMKNNKTHDPYIVLCGLGRAINVSVNSAPAGDCRNQVAASVIEMILMQSDVCPEDVLRELRLVMHGGKLDA